MTIKRFLSIVALSMSLLGASAAVADYNVVPLPQTITAGKGTAFRLTAATPVVYTGSDEAMKQNAAFLAEYVKQSTGLALTTSTVKEKKKPAIVLAINPKIKGDEAYRIVVTAKQITIEGSTSAGVFYGVQTLRKSLPVLDKAEDIDLPAVTVSDSPRFGYRGMMLDCCRHFFPFEFVKKYIDILAMHNMNRFHWHLSDDQGWRIEIKSHPELTEKGSMRTGTVMGRNAELDDGIPHGGFYTQEQCREIVEYARQRHITVIPEIDLPGHTESVLATYPELGCTGGPYEVEHKWGVFPDVLCIGNEKVYKLVEDVIDELCDIFPSEYIHIGGDECPTVRWEKCPKCQALAKANNTDMKHVQGVFTNRLEKYVNSKGRRIIGWDEILGGKINQSATIMSWRGAEPGSKAAAAGHDVIMTPNDYFYFDYYETKNRDREPLCIGGYVPVSRVYEFDPAPPTFSEEAKSHILGAQANLWAEYIPNTNMVEYMVLPRAAALSEVQWVPTAKKNFGEFRVRLDRLVKLYDRCGYIYSRHLWEDKAE